MYCRLRIAVALLLLVAIPAVVSAGDVLLVIRDGRVMLSARDAPLRDVLAEWERVGGTRMIGVESVPAILITVDLVSVPEGKALATLLRALPGYFAAMRSPNGTGASIYERVVIAGDSSPSAQAAANRAPSPSQPAPPSGTVQRRMMADGRVVSFVDDPERPGGITPVDDDGNPIPVETGAASSQPGRSPLGQEPSGLDDPSRGQGQGGAALRLPGTTGVGTPPPGATPSGQRQMPGQSPPRPPGRQR